MSLLTTMIILALIATIISLVWGVGSMILGGRYDEEHSVQLMSARVGFQFLAVVLILIAAVMSS